MIVCAVSLGLCIPDDSQKRETKIHPKCKKTNHFLINAARQFDVNVTQIQPVKCAHNRTEIVVKGRVDDLDKFGSFVDELERYFPKFLQMQHVDLRRTKTKHRFTLRLGVKQCV